MRGTRAERPGLRRTVGYARMIRYDRGGVALLTGANAVLVALLMAGSSAATATTGALTVSPAYKGLVEPDNQIFDSGCSAKATLKHFKFNLHTGTGTGAGTGKAGNCGKKAPKGFSSDSNGGMYGGFGPALIKLPKVPSTTSNISANLAGKWTVTGSASDGGSLACSNSYSYYGSSTWWYWNNFANAAYNESEFYDGVWYNYSYNLASIPTPFVYNNTTYQENYSYSDYSAYCSVSAFFDYDLYGYLYDANTGDTTFYSGSSAPEFAYTEVEVENDTYDYWQNSSYWDEGYSYGPSNYSYSYSFAGTEYSTYSYSPTTGSYSNYTTGTSSSLSYTNTTKFAGDSMWWTGPFSSTDQYYLELYLDVDGSADNDDFSHGSASFNFNMLSAGNGFKLSSITLT